MSTVTNSFGDAASEDRGPALRIYVTVLFTIALITTLLRFWSRALYVPPDRNSYRFWWDDWIALAAALSFTLEVIVTLLLIKSGLGRHLWALSQPQLATTFKYVYAFHFVYALTIPLSKASALLFLTRIFPDYTRTAWFSVIVRATHIINIGWFIGIVIASVFNCSPIKKNWQPWASGTCRPTHELYLGSAVPNVFIDLIILLLPMPRVWRLRTGIARRCAITAIFILGYTAIVTSLGRLIVTYTQATALETDITYEGLSVFYWTYAESAILILSISLPALPNLLHYLNKDLFPSARRKFSMVFKYRALGGRPSNSLGDKGFYAEPNEALA